MLHLYIGTDTVKARKALNAALAETVRERVIRITDAHTLGDLRAALAGGGLFDEARVVILEGTLVNEEMRTVVNSALPLMQAASGTFHLIEERIDVATRKLLEKHAESVAVFDPPKRAKPASNIFALADALKRGDRKRLWIGYRRALMEGTAAETIHGVLFWGAKDMLLKARDEKTQLRARNLVTQLVRLPHEARRQSEDVGYALERFALSRM